MTRLKTAAARQSMDAIQSMLDRVEKKADANTEAGGFQGSTTHPVKDVDDRTDDAQTGAREAENTADVKHDQGSPSVDNTAAGTPGGQDSVQYNIGLNQSATGEDSAVETDSAKGGKEDGGTYDSTSSHPARTDNESLDGHKYASAKAVLELTKVAQDKGTALLAKIACESDGTLKKKAEEVQKQAEGEGAAKLPPETVSDADSNASNPPPGKGKSGDSEKDAAEAGAQLAEAQAQQKEAQDHVVVGSLAETIKIANAMAAQTAEFLDGMKQAEEEEVPAEDPSGNSDGGEAPAEAPAEAGPAELLAEGGAPEPELGGDLIGDPMGGEMGGELGGELGGGELQQAFAQLAQMPEEQLMELLQGGESMGGEEAIGDMAGGMGGEPPMGEPPMGGPELVGAPPVGGPEMGGPEMGGDPAAGGGEEAMLQEALGQAKISAVQFENLVAKKMAHDLHAGQVPATGMWQPKTAEEQARYKQIASYVNEVVRRG